MWSESPAWTRLDRSILAVGAPPSTFAVSGDDVDEVAWCSRIDVGESAAAHDDRVRVGSEAPRVRLARQADVPARVELPRVEVASGGARRCRSTARAGRALSLLWPSVVASLSVTVTRPSTAFVVRLTAMSSLTPPPCAVTRTRVGFVVPPRPRRLPLSLPGLAPSGPASWPASTGLFPESPFAASCAPLSFWPVVLPLSPAVPPSARVYGAAQELQATARNAAQNTTPDNADLLHGETPLPAAAPHCAPLARALSREARAWTRERSVSGLPDHPPPRPSQTLRSALSGRSVVSSGVSRVRPRLPWRRPHWSLTSFPGGRRTHVRSATTTRGWQSPRRVMRLAAPTTGLVPRRRSPRQPARTSTNLSRTKSRIASAT